MIKITNIETYGWKAAVRGMRNPMNSWEKSDSSNCFDDLFCGTCPLCDVENSGISIGVNPYIIGPNDLSLMLKLAKAGSDHAKFRRMITVTMDILAPLYWWKEADTYKVGTVANSCSTMHKITGKEFTLDDFSHEHLYQSPRRGEDILEKIVDDLNFFRKEYLETGNELDWWQIIQLLPSSYNQLRTVQLNYEVLSNIYHSRCEHKLDEWRDFCECIKTLPYSEIITA